MKIRTLRVTLSKTIPVQDEPTCADKQDQHNKCASDLLESSAQGKKLIKNVANNHKSFILCNK